MWLAIFIRRNIPTFPNFVLPIYSATAVVLSFGSVYIQAQQGNRFFLVCERLFQTNLTQCRDTWNFGLLRIEYIVCTKY